MHKRAIILLLLLYFFIPTTAQSTEVSIPDINVYTTNTVEVPLNIDSIPGMDGLAGFQVTVNYNPSVIQLASVNRGEMTQSPDWTIVNDISTDGEIKLVVFDQQVTGSLDPGSLLTFTFNVVGNVYDTTPINLSGLALSDINGNYIVASSVSGSLTISLEDNDNDGIPNSLDNCPDVSNPDQLNHDRSVFGLRDTNYGRRSDLALYIPDREGTIESWLVIGPFDNGFDTNCQFNGAYIDEENVSPNEGDTSSDKIWDIKPAYQYEYFDFSDHFGPVNDNSVAYAFAYVYSEKDKPMQLNLTSSDGIQVWLNGVQVHDYQGCRELDDEEDIIQVDLKKGFNNLLLKIGNNTGDWKFRARFVEPVEPCVSGFPCMLTIRYSLDMPQDSYGNACDNCRFATNEDQTDTDNDGLGDICDADRDGDGIADAEEDVLGTEIGSDDSDNDGVDDMHDVFPIDETEAYDSDASVIEIDSSLYPVSFDISGNTLSWLNGAQDKIFTYDFSTSIESNCTFTPVIGQHAISGKYLIFNHEGLPDWSYYDISQCSLTSHSASDTLYLGASGKRFVWDDNRRGVSDIFLYDIDSGDDFQVTANYNQLKELYPGQYFSLLDDSQTQPSISSDYIVWQDDRNGQWDIYMYDFTRMEEVRITTDPANQINPDVSGDIIVWSDNRNGTYDIYMYDISTGGPEIRLTSGPKGETEPAIYGSTVVWQDNRNGQWDIYMCDIKSDGPEIRITDDEGIQYSPRISSHRITWIDIRSLTTKKVYVYTGDGVGDNSDNCPYVYNPAPQTDLDGDNIGDACDCNSQGCNPTADTDGDGISDQDELYYDVNDPNGDADGDGLINVEEFTSGTNPRLSDSDDDGLEDGIDPFPTDGSKGWTDSDLQARFTLIKTVHITELRNAIDNLRTSKGLPGYSWTALDTIRAQDINDLRDAIEDVGGQQIWTNDPIEAGVTVVKTTHINEIRQRIENAL